MKYQLGPNYQLQRYVTNRCLMLSVRVFIFFVSLVLLSVMKTSIAHAYSLTIHSFYDTNQNGVQDGAELSAGADATQAPAATFVLKYSADNSTIYSSPTDTAGNWFSGAVPRDGYYVTTTQCAPNGSSGGTVWGPSQISSDMTVTIPRGLCPPPPPTVTLTANPTSVPSGGSANLTWSSTNATSCSATWSASTATSYIQTLTNLTATATYTITCTGPSSPAASTQVTITVTPSPWFQVNGKVQSQGNPSSPANPAADSIKSLIPPCGIPPCKYFSVGTKTVVSANGAINIGSDPNLFGSPVPVYQATGYKAKAQNYSYASFRNRLQASPSSWSGGTTLPASPGVYQADVSGGYFTVGTSWNVLAGQYYTIFVNGELHIDSNITVAQNGLLAFIVSDDIKIKSTVTQVQGIYFANGKIYSTY